MSKSESRPTKDDRHRRRHRAQLARQREAAIDLVAEADVDQREVGRARGTPPWRPAVRRRSPPRGRDGAGRPWSWRGWRAHPRQWRFGACGIGVGEGSAAGRGSATGSCADYTQRFHVLPAVCRVGCHALATRRFRRTAHCLPCVMRSIEGDAAGPASPLKGKAHHHLAAHAGQTQGQGPWRTSNVRAQSTDCSSREDPLAALVADSFIRPGLVVSGVRARGFIVTSLRRPRHADTTPVCCTVRRPGGKPRRAAMFTDVRMSVTGIVNRVTVEQRFVNPTDEWRKACTSSRCPRPPSTTCARRVGGRVIRGPDQRTRPGQLFTRQQVGRPQATLVDGAPDLQHDQRRTSGRREEIRGAIENQETARYDEAAPSGCAFHGDHAAVHPRRSGSRPGSGHGWSRPPTRQSRRRPHRRRSSRAGYNAATADERPRHGRTVERRRARPPDGRSKDAATIAIALAPGWVRFPACATSKLAAWTSRRRTRHRALHGDQRARGRLPPDGAAADGSDSRPRAARRDHIVDTPSGSMEGVSMTQAATRAGARPPAARRSFNVIEFSSTTLAVHAAPVGVDAVAAARARSSSACAPAAAGDAARARIALAGRRPILRCARWCSRRRGRQRRRRSMKLVGERIGDRRLFTIGIGPAPGMFFMTKAAQFGRGTYRRSATCARCAKMTALFRKLGRRADRLDVTLWPASTDGVASAIKLPISILQKRPVVVTAVVTRAPRGNVRAARRRAATRMATSSGDDAREARSPNWRAVGVPWKIDALMDAGRRAAWTDPRGGARRGAFTWSPSSRASSRST